MNIKFLQKRKEAKNIYSFYFEKPDKFSFMPGQYLYMTIPWLRSDYRGPTRHFTISSAPQHDRLRITTFVRKKSAFKSALMQLKKGDKLEAAGPTGTFILDEAEKGKHLLIAGGIGITPFMSIIDYHLDSGLDFGFDLLYSVSGPDQLIFADELKETNANVVDFNLHLTYTKSAPENWNGWTGRVNRQMLTKFTDTEKKYWLCGPPKMVVDLEKILKELDIDSSDIVSEKFTGY